MGSKVLIAQNFADNLTNGLTGYLTYESVVGVGQAFSEYFLYAPILRIAKSLSWEVVDQLPIPNGRNHKGPNKTIDFAFHKNDTAIMLEVKWVARTTSSSNVLTNLRNDIDKLLSPQSKKAIRGRFKSLTTGANFLSWVLVVGHVKQSTSKSMPHVVGSKKVEKCHKSARWISKADLKAPRRRYGAVLYEL